MKYSPFFFLNSAFAFIILNNNLRGFFYFICRVVVNFPQLYTVMAEDPAK